MINTAQPSQSNIRRPASITSAEDRGLAADRMTLLACLVRWERRRRLTLLAVSVPRGLITGSVISLALSLIARTRPLLTLAPLEALTVFILIGSAALAALIIVLWPRALPVAARMFDQRFAASERLSTALELAVPDRSEGASPFAVLQVRDARRYAESIDARVRLPIRWLRRELIALSVLLIILSVSIVLPNPQIGILTHQQILQTAISQQIAGLTQVAHAAQNNPALTTTQQTAIANTAQTAITALSKPGVGQIEAAAILSQAAQQFQAIPHDTAPVPNTAQAAANQQAGTALSKGAQASSPPIAPGMAQLGAALQKGDLSGAASAAQSLSQSLTTANSGTGSATDAAVKAFAQAASALQATDPHTAQAFTQAAQALTAGDSTAAQKALAQAASALQAAQQAAQQQASQAAQSPVAQAAQQAASQAAQGAQQLAQSGNQAGQSATTGNQPGDQSGARGQPGSAGSPNSSATGSAADTTGGNPANSASGGQSGKTGGVQVSTGSDGSQPGSTVPHLIGQNGQPVAPSGNSAQANSGGSTGSAAAGQGAGGAGSDTTGGTGGGTGKTGTGSSGTPGGTIPTNNGQGDGTLTTTEHVYAPSFINGSGGTALAVPNAPNTDPGAPIVNPNNPNIPQPANATVPLDTVIESAAAQSGVAMDAAHVPISLRGVIHDYFSGLQNTAAQTTPASPVQSTSVAPGSP